MSASDLTLHALCIYAESLAAGRRVVVIGDASLGLQERLVELGARTVHVYDPVAARALALASTGAGRAVSVRALPEGDFDVRDGAFDLALVPDLGVLHEPAALLARLRRVVGVTGAVILAAKNRDVAEAGTPSFDYYELYDLVSLQFASVRMVAQLPFVGVTLAELGEDEVEGGVAVDTQLAGASGPPDVFIAVAAQADVAPDLARYTIVQLPAPTEPPPPPSVPEASVDVDPSALIEAVLRANVLASQVEQLRAERSDVSATVEELRRTLDALAVERDRAERLSRDLDQARRVGERMAAEPAARIAALEDGIRLAEQTIVALRDRLGATEEALREASSENEVLRAQAEKLQRQLTSAVAAPRATVATVDRGALARLEAELVMHARAQEAHEEELFAMEQKLRDRGEAITELEHEVRRREGIVRELLAAVEQGSAPPASEGDEDVNAENVELRRKLDVLATTAARQKSELEAYRWRVAELERPPETKAEPPRVEQAAPRSSADAELDALRQALAQEHEARLRAENGEALRQARADLEKQAVLLQQITRARTS
jgi:hypothetical protein